MVAHTAIDGIPCSANPWLLNDILRDEWGVEGFTVPDNTGVQKNHYIHFMAESRDQSSQFCIEPGEFRIMAGSSSTDIRAEKTIRL